jgi:CRP/FNR family transcriptional regulator, cyclic AMP receptor protein
LEEAAAGIKRAEVVMLHKKNQRVDWEPFLAGISSGKTAIEYGANDIIFSQGDPADSVFYLRRGKVKLAVTSKQDREAIVAILGDGEFFGEGYLAGRRLRIATATAMTDCTLARVERPLFTGRG